MLDKKTEMINSIYEYILEEISISETMLNKAIKSYEAVGKWLGECDPDLDVKIMPQGSVNLGTVIKPISDEDDYDIDLVCLLKNGRELSAKEIKTIVGNRLKENSMYSRMLDEEGKRCWTLRYDEFHMDILPAVPMRIEYIEPDNTGIRLTHRIADGVYTDKYSDPAKYKLWFEDRMKTVLLESKQSFAVRNQVEIDDVPTYLVKTPLQKAIQLLKRHRDTMFVDDKENLAPISIIISTLAAEAYRNENNVFEAVSGILDRMGSYILKDKNGRYIIKNPVMEAENFADKWSSEPSKAEAFFNWLDTAKQDIVSNPILCKDNLECSSGLKKSFGERVVNSAYNRLGDKIRNARENDRLYVSGLKDGISMEDKLNAEPVPRHTFYG